MAFDNTTASGTSVLRSDLRRISGSPAWWDLSQSVEPFMAFLQEARNEILKAVGPHGQALPLFDAYIGDYKNGRTESKDYSEILYNSGLPASELDKIEPRLDRIGRKFFSGG